MKGEVVFGRDLAPLLLCCCLCVRLLETGESIRQEKWNAVLRQTNGVFAKGGFAKEDVSVKNRGECRIKGGVSAPPPDHTCPLYGQGKGFGHYAGGGKMEGWGQSGG